MFVGRVDSISVLSCLVLATTFSPEIDKKKGRWKIERDIFLLLLLVLLLLFLV